MKRDTSADQNVARIKKEWLDYEGEVAKHRKPYDNEIQKQQDIDTLGPASKALLEYVNNTNGNVVLGECIRSIRQKTALGHSEDWWYRRLVVLVLEGFITARVYRTSGTDKVFLTFRKKESGA